MVGLALPWWKKVYHDTAELAAIKHALVWIKKRKYSQSVIFSDSLSSIQSIQGSQSTTPDIIAAIQIELKEIERHNLTVTYEWLPAHVGIVGNETADAGAKAALVTANKGMLTDVPLGIRVQSQEALHQQMARGLGSGSQHLALQHQTYGQLKETWLQKPIN